MQGTQGSAEVQEMERLGRDAGSAGGAGESPCSWAHYARGLLKALSRHLESSGVCARPVPWKYC